MRLRAALGALVLALATLASGSAVTAGAETLAAEPPVYGVLSGSPPYREPLFLTRLHPRTLAPLPSPRLAVPRRMAPAGRSPDGRHVAFFERQPALVRVIDLETMRVRGDLPLRLGKRWRIREAAWLTADRLVLVVQRLRGSYEQIVDTRQIVVVDPLALRVVERRPFANAMALLTHAVGGDRLVLLFGRGDRKDKKLVLAVVSSSGALRTVELTLEGATPSFPALAVQASGGRAFVISAGTPVLDVDLESLQVSRRAVTGAGVLFGSHPWALRGVLRLDDDTLAVYGSNTTVRRNGETSEPAGLALLDTTTWQARLIDPQASGATLGAGKLVAYGRRVESVGAPGRPQRQRESGIGLRAYDANGALLWRRLAGQLVSASAFRDLALVYGHPRSGFSGVFPIELATGRRIGPTRETNFWLLPEPVAPRRALAAGTGARQALDVAGNGELLGGSVRDDVTRVVAVLVDGSERELVLDAGRFAYQAESADRSARAVQAFVGEQLVASVTLSVRCGGAAGPCAAPAAVAREPAYAILGGVPAGGSTLVRVDPRTLRPVGRSLVLREPYLYPRARSPDGTKVALTTYKSSLIRIVDLERLRLVRELRLPGALEARALGWVTADRLLAVAQRMSRPTRRYVRERSAVVLDLATGRIVSRRPLTNELAVAGIGEGGDRLVLLLRSSLGQGTTVELSVLEADGTVRSRAIEVGRRRGGALARPSLAVEPSGRRAFLLTPAAGRETPPIVEIDLETLSVSRRQLQVEAGRELPRAAMGGGVYVEAAGDRLLVAAGAVAATEGPDDSPMPAAGVFVIDTETWTARLLDPRALYFRVHEDRVLTYGPGSPPVRGTGVSVYDLSGRRLSHLYGTRTFSRVELAGGYGHILLDPSRAKRLVFDVRTGEALGMLPALRQRLELLEPPRPRTARRALAAVPAGSRQGTDPFARVSSRGTRVRARATGPGEREHAPRDLFLLRREAGRAVYRIGGVRAGFRSCYGAGRAGDLGRLGLTVCSRAGSAGFPSREQPLLDLSVLQGRRGRQSRELYRLEGVAADAVAEIGLLDADGDVIARVPVESNVYLLADPPAEASGHLVAYDREGRVVYRTDRRRARNPPPPPIGPRTLAGFRLRLLLPRGWSGEMRRSPAGPFRALLLAGNGLPAPSPRSVSLALTERDPLDRPAYPRLAGPPRLLPTDVRATGAGRGRLERRFTLAGRQFRLQLLFGTARPSAASLAAVNRMLASLEVGAIAVRPSGPPSEKPLQRGRAEGVTVDVYRSGTVVFRFDPAGPLLRQLDGRSVGLACLTFDSVSPWEPNEAWVSRRAAATVQFRISEATRPRQPYATVDPPTEARAPFDGCLVSGSHGRRWNDPRGQHSPAEIAFTARGRRFFDERAAARDLALFARSPKLAAARRAMKRGAAAPSAVALLRGLPARVVAFPRRSQLPARGEIGVWSNGRDTIVLSVRSEAGRRLFVEIRDGRIGRHNLEGLAFVF